MIAPLEGNLAYISVRALVWIAASVLQFAHVATRAHAPTRRPRTFAYAIAGTTSLFAVRDLWLLVTVSYDHGAIAYVTDFLDALALGPFYCVLLLISSGFCITVSKLADVKRYNFVLPAAAQILELGVLWAIQTIQGNLLRAKEEGAHVNWARIREGLAVLILMAMVRLVMILTIWFIIIYNGIKVVRQLAATAPRRMAQAGGVPPQVPPTDAAAGYEDPAAAFETPQVTTTVVDEVDHLQKASLMRRFMYAVSLFLVIDIVVHFLLISDPERTDAAIIFVVQNFLLLLLLMALAYVFRVRPENNPYLLVAEDEDEVVQLDTRIEMQGMRVHPMQHSPSPPLGQSTSAGGRAGGAAVGGGRIEAAFTLDETERPD